MLSAIRQPDVASPAEHGFTLVEVVVALVTGMIVSLALFSILDTYARQTGRISDVAQATNVGRTAMTHIVDELHSTCIKEAFAPVKSGSTESKLIFVNGFFPEKANESTEPEYSFVRKNTIEYSGGKLTEEKWKATGEESSGEFPWSSLGKTTIATNVAQAEEGKALPVFSYYKYGTSYSTEASKAAQTLEKMSVTTLTSAQASEVAAVEVKFRTEPYKTEYKFGSASEPGTKLSQSTLVTFALGAPNSEATISAKPCE